MTAVRRFRQGGITGGLLAAVAMVMCSAATADPSEAGHARPAMAAGQSPERAVSARDLLREDAGRAGVSANQTARATKQQSPASVQAEGAGHMPDLEVLRGCFGGSGAPAGEGCRQWDRDGDGDVDIVDVAAWMADDGGARGAQRSGAGRGAQRGGGGRGAERGSGGRGAERGGGGRGAQRGGGGRGAQRSDPQIIVGTVVRAEVVPGGAGESDRIAYRVGSKIVAGNTQGIHLFGFDVLTDTGVTQPLPVLAWGEYDGFSNAEALWVTWKGTPVFNGGWGADNAGLPTQGNPWDDDVLGVGSSLGLGWDADVDDDASNGYQPARRAGIGLGQFRGWNGGPDDPFDDDATWPPGENDGQVIRDGVWTWFTGEIVLEDANGEPIAAGTYRVDYRLIAVNVLGGESDLRRDWPNDTGSGVTQVGPEGWRHSWMTFEVSIDGEGAARIRNLVVVNGGLDCNGNGVDDADDIADGTSADCNGNEIPDECEGGDCNGNGVLDECDIRDGTSEDCDGNSVPDECEADCNGNGVNDTCDIRTGTSEDCNRNGVPDECDLADGTSADCNGNGVPDECEADCNGNGIADECDIVNGTSEDCNGNNVPDECEVSGLLGPMEGAYVLWDNGLFDGWNGLGSERDTLITEPTMVADDFIVGRGGWAVRGVRVQTINMPGRDLRAVDVRIYGVEPSQGGPDEHNVLYSAMDLPVVEIDTGQRPFGFDLNDLYVELPAVHVPEGRYFLMVRGVGNGPEEGNRSFWATAGYGSLRGEDMGWYHAPYFGFPYWTPVATVMGQPTDFAFQIFGATADCNGNAVPDECDIADGTSEDCNRNGVPDECESMPDSDGDTVPDECDLCPLGPAGGGVNGSGVPLGDFDADCDVDLEDFTHFAACFRGSGQPVGDGCADADFDGDGDVDIVDFSTFAANYGGSG